MTSRVAQDSPAILGTNLPLPSVPHHGRPEPGRRLMASALITPARVVTVLVIPPTVTAAVCAWWALDSAAYAYRLWRNLRSSKCPT